jgi:hypothetical protein
MFKNNLIVQGAKGWFICLISILVLLIAVLSGCGFPNYGRLQSSHEVTQIFKNNQILSDHQYYFSGFQRIPYGIIGIGNNYKLRSNRWKPIDLNPTSLNQLAYRMTNVYSLEPRGAWILDPDGNRVGIWYSSIYQTKVKIEKDNHVVVVTPEPPDLRGIP